MIQHLDDGTIHAWLDGAVRAGESDVIADHIAECEQCGAAVAEARGLIAASSRILSALDDVPGNAVPSATLPSRARWNEARAGRARRNLYLRAAGVLIVVGLSATVIRQQQKGTFPSRESSSTDAALSVKALDTSVQKLEGPVAAPSPVAPAERTAVNQAKSPPPVRRMESIGSRRGAIGSVSQAASKMKSDSAAGVGAGNAEADVAAAAFVLNDSGLVASGDTAVYEVRSGVTVTLVVDSVAADVRKMEDRVSAAERKATKSMMSKQIVEKRAASAPPPPPPPPSSVLPPMNTIRWFDSTSRRWLSLKGRLTVGQLDSVKALLPRLRRVESR
jgi:hypothetical protein